MADASDVIDRLQSISDPREIDKVARFFKGGDESTEILGVPIGKVFPIAKEFSGIDLDDIEALLDDSRYEVRMAGVSILDFKARRKKLTTAERRALFELYLRKHDRINNWDLVDRAAPHVVGEYLVDADRSVLDELAGSADPNRRRTALVCTHAFIKRGEVAETFRIAGMLAEDRDDYVQKAIASWVREAGKRDCDALVDFLGRHRQRLRKSTFTAAAKLLPKEVVARLRS